MKIAALIPAYNPTEQLIALVSDLLSLNFSSVIVVNDGSLTDCEHIFDKIKSIKQVTVLHHAVNLGKGLALKTGLNYAYCNFPEMIGVVTLDADGQHLTEDALNVAHTLLDNPASIVMGVRVFDKNVPLRSKIGNVLTKKLYRFLVGQKLTDTQSGLRGIPRDLITNLLKIDSNGYEFELDMLLACKYSNRKIIERKISTVYLEGNKSSNFNPLLDSMKIYFVLFRFTFASLSTAIIDYSVFILAFRFNSSLAASQVLARLIAMIFNYAAVKKLVFYSEQKHIKTLPKYIALVFISGSISLLLINIIIAYTSLNVIAAKVISELLVFFANFAIQRDFIFSKSTKSQTSTDWDRYYNKPYKLASFTRRITESRLHRLIDTYVTKNKGGIIIGELGGANSCFYDGIKSKFKPAQYHVFDNNQIGLDMFNTKIGSDPSTQLHNLNVLNMKNILDLDLVFSVGLIEHFSVEDTKKAIIAHFKVLKPNGIVIISFPTPTFLYKTCRRVCEWLHIWIFHDERPLLFDEVASVVNEYGTIVYDEIIWLTFLTQRILVIKKNCLLWTDKDL